MSQYSQRRGSWGRQRIFQEEEEDDAFVRPVRRENVALGLKERLPLPSNPKSSSNPSSPTPPAYPSGGHSQLQQPSQPKSNPPPQQQTSSQPRTRDPRLNASSDYENAGRSLTNSSAGKTRTPGHNPVKHTKPQNQASDRGILREKEEINGALFGSSSYTSGSQPTYNRPSDYERDIDSKSLMISPTIGGSPSMMNSPRSIVIGFDDSAPANPQHTNPTALAPMPQTHARRGANTVPPSSRRGISSSYYPQPAKQVFPIPEESPRNEPSRKGSPNIHNGSKDSSHVIPSAWGNIDYPAQVSPSMYGEEDEEEDNYRPVPTEDDDEQKGLVRQASLGRKSKPKITEIRSLSRQDSTKQASSNTDSPSLGPSVSPPPTANNPPLTTMPRTVSTPNSAKVPSPLMAFSFPAPGNYDGGDRKEAESLSTQFSTDSLPPSRSSSMFVPMVEPPNTSKSMAARMKGRRPPPPGLNMNAVRDAEARGSLTSLPDLIRRATKLASVLENGKPRTGPIGSSLRGSFSASYLSNNSNRRTDSISDILASFPPPVPGASSGGASRTGTKGSHVSAWPLPADFMDIGEDTSEKSTAKKGRKICGLPLWAFVLLVILALLVTAAAVIVPLQLVTLSRGQDNKTTSNSDTEILQQCKIKNPCSNGGGNVATKDFCGCVCTGGYGGKTCTKLDSSCVTMDLKEIKSFGDTFSGIQNATMGSAIKRLLEISSPKYNVQLDGSRILGAFWASEVSCTAQNALVTFNGKTAPEDSSVTTLPITPTPTPTSVKMAKRAASVDEGLVYDTSSIVTQTQGMPSGATLTATAKATPSVTISTGTRLDEDAVDFSRVAVLFLVQDKGLTVAVTAQENLQSKFTAGIAYGSLDAGNQVTVDLDNRILNLPGGSKVGGPKTTAT